MLKVAQLTASRFFGGPERQMLELAGYLPSNVETKFVSFAEGGLCNDFLARAKKLGFEAHQLEHDMPKLVKAKQELADWMVEKQIDLLCCEGYKPDILGHNAARSLGIPVMSISRGWTAESWKVRLYEMLDKRFLRKMDHVVCVSKEQGRRVANCGVANDKLTVIHNAIRTNRFNPSTAALREEIESWFPNTEPKPKVIVAAAGRLSPEKGFDVLVAAAASAIRENGDVGFVVFGDGKLREKLQQEINRQGISNRFVLVGFRSDVDKYLPNFDLFALSSYTEGLPNVVLEAMASKLPVVATDVGGTGEVVVDGTTGRLVESGDSDTFAVRTLELAAAKSQRERMGIEGRNRVLELFSFENQAKQYCQLFQQLTGTPIADEEEQLLIA